MREKTCCFTGHRLIPAGEYVSLQWEVERVAEELIQKGVSRFVVGGALGFDTLAAEVILELREKYPSIRLHLILPCRGQEKYWSGLEKRRYRKVLARADQVDYIAEHYFNGCMQLRNQAMVEASAYCVAYCTRCTGGTAYTVRQARRMGSKVIFLSGRGAEKSGSSARKGATAIKMR